MSAVVIQPRNGVLYSTTIAGIGTAYDQTQLIGADTSVVTLPLGQTYSIGLNQLIVWVDGIAQESNSIDYAETNSTTITFQKTIKAGQRVRIRKA